MHHRNVRRLLWMYDIHLLVSRLSTQELRQFTELALDRGVATICAEQLTAARSRFATPIPHEVTARLSAPRRAEPSSAYLNPKRRWRHELASSLRGLPRWSDRLRLLREVLLPDVSYMLKAYRGTPRLLLPLLYAHRLMRGGFRVTTGRK